MNTKFKKSLALLLCMVMMLGCVPFGVSATEEMYTVGDLIYTLNVEEKTAEVVHAANVETIDIPETITAGDVIYDVTSIEELAFSNCNNLENIIIPDSVTSIGENAFELCKLRKIIIPDSVTSVDGFAFFGCDQLESVQISNSMTSISIGMFYYCINLKTVIIPKSVTNINSGAFYRCSSLAHVYYPGTEAEWNEITIGTENETLTNATIHFQHECTYDWEITTPATCTIDGEKTGTCVCGATITEVVPAAHNFGEWTITTPATCTEKGEETRTCAECSEVETREIVAKGHVDADEDGICDNCEQEMPQDENPIKTLFNFWKMIKDFFDSIIDFFRSFGDMS